MLSTQHRFLSTVLLLGLFSQCQEVPPAASRLVYVSADQTNVAARPSAGCAFRYGIVNTFGRLDNDGQRDAIRAGFTCWQKLSPNLGFLEFSTVDRADLLIRFVDPGVVQAQPVTVPVGLVRGSASVASTLRREANGTYAILLSNAFDWDKTTLTKAIAYHAGLFLGMATSTESNSLMSPLLVGQSVAASPADSVGVNRLYTAACRDLNVGYLPLSFKVGGLVTKTVKFDRQGTISIKASGQMAVGFWVGNSGPEGKLDGGVINASLAGYSLVPTMYHAALMYKVDNEPNWRYWKDEQTIKTDDRQFVDITFQINDNTQSDNSGAYDVVVDYQ